MESRTIRYGATAFTALLLAFGGRDSAQAQAHDPGRRDPTEALENRLSHYRACRMLSRSYSMPASKRSEILKESTMSLGRE
jgi:hypothetical protein